MSVLVLDVDAALLADVVPAADGRGTLLVMEWADQGTSLVLDEQPIDKHNIAQCKHCQHEWLRA